MDSTIAQTEDVSPEAKFRLDLRSLTQVYIEQNVDRDAEDWAHVRSRFQQSFASLTQAAKEGFDISKTSRGRKRSFSHLRDRAPSLQSVQEMDYSVPAMEQSQPRYPGHPPAERRVSQPDLPEHRYGLPQPFPRPFAASVQDPISDFQPQDLLALSQPHVHSNAGLLTHDYGPAIPSTGTSSNFDERLTSPRYGQPARTMSWDSLQRNQQNPAAEFDHPSSGRSAGINAPASSFQAQTPFNPDVSVFSTSISRQAFDLDYSSNLR